MRRLCAALTPLNPVQLLKYYTRSVSENIQGGIISCLILLDKPTWPSENTRSPRAAPAPVPLLQHQTNEISQVQKETELQVTTFQSIFDRSGFEHYSWRRCEGSKSPDRSWGLVVRSFSKLLFFIAYQFFFFDIGFGYLQRRSMNM